MKSYSKQIEVCLAGLDENNLSAALLAAHPEVAFVDGVIFPTRKPILCDSIERCTSTGQILLWERSIFPTLPMVPRKDGQFVGPNTGAVIQYLRPFVRDGKMHSGRIAASAGGYEEPTESANNIFVRDVFRILKELTTDVQCVSKSHQVLNKKVSAFRAGQHAARWLSERPDRFFTDASSNLYVPLEKRPPRSPKPPF